LAGYKQTDLSGVILNDANVYLSPGDKYASKPRYDTLTYFDNYWGIAYRGTYTNVSNFMTDSPTQQISYCFVLRLPTTAPLDTTPLGFTRGLREDGKWDEKAGLYGSKGGYVVYADGHVTWFDGSKPAKFLKWDKSGYTSDIRQAVPSSTWITCGNEKTRMDYKSEDGSNSLVILYHAGTGGE
jgi:prepilin-type processing-associated H-X9-DG protein